MINKERGNGNNNNNNKNQWNKVNEISIYETNINNNKWTN